jgi:hypothetical protein
LGITIARRNAGHPYFDQGAPSMMAADSATLPERTDIWRIDGIRPSSGFKEWQHFALFAPGMDLIVNFSIDERADSKRTARVIVLAKTDHWHGALDTADAEISRDARRASFGAASLDIRNGVYRVSVDWPQHGIGIAATLRPVTVPLYATHRPTADGGRLYWALVARLTTEGTATLGRRTYALINTLAYHDHNWGTFSWGSDFAWEWGAFLPDSPACPYSCVFSRVTNRARTLVQSQHLFVWKDTRNVLAADDDDVVKEEYAGQLLETHPFRLPAEMALTDGRRDAGLPTGIEIRGSAGPDMMTIAFQCDSSSRILIPSERDPFGTIAINELVGDVIASGNLSNEALSWRGRGIFELLRV